MSTDAVKEKYASETRLRPLMGTLCSIEARGPVDSVRIAISRAFDRMTQLDMCMHPSNPGSDLARLNSGAGEFKVNPDLWELLVIAQRIHMLSQGVFDPCLPQCVGTLGDIELLPDSTAICRAPVALDLGGIAKGYAIDRAVDVLLASGCISGIVNAGGDLRVFGESSQSVSLRAKDGRTFELKLHDAALAVSEVDAANRPPEHQGYYLRSGDYEPLHRQVIVLAKEAVIADALTKCAMFCSDAAIESLFSALNAELVSNPGVNDEPSSERARPR